jgi:acyl carrier protein
MDYREEIRKYLRGLLLSGRLASVDAVDVVVFLEERFGVNFYEIGFDQTLIDSVNAIYTLILTVRK